MFTQSLRTLLFIIAHIVFIPVLIVCILANWVGKLFLAIGLGLAMGGGWIVTKFPVHWICPKPPIWYLRKQYKKAVAEAEKMNKFKADTLNKVFSLTNGGEGTTRDASDFPIDYAEIQAQIFDEDYDGPEKDDIIEYPEDD